MKVWVYDGGGRAGSKYNGTAGDCFVRAVVIAGEFTYESVYDEFNVFAKSNERKKQGRSNSSSRTGVYAATARRYMARVLGWEWTPTMAIGQGCKVHLKADELPAGRLVVSVSKHFTAVVDGVVHDTYDPTRNGTRCVYGYWKVP